MPQASATLDAKFGVVDSKALATAAGITVPSLRVLRSRAIKRREEKASLPTDLPSPDGTIGRSPVWTADTAQKWLAARAEAGLDSQPPRHQKAEEGRDTPAKKPAKAVKKAAAPKPDIKSKARKKSAAKKR